MVLEDSNEDYGHEPYVADLDELWLCCSSGLLDLVGQERRRALFAGFASALQNRWTHGGYRFRFAEKARTPSAAPADDARQASTLLQAIFPGLRSETFGVTWCDPIVALDDYLDRWLFFRVHRPYVRHDDVPDWMMPALREPWAACVRELVAGAAGARAAVVEGELLVEAWGDHGVALVVAAATRLNVLHVGLWTD
jgi:hypothetical protein